MKCKTVVCKHKTNCNGFVGRRRFMLWHFSYLEGEDAKKLLPTYSPKEQYEIGIEAGKDLAKMHTYEAPNDILPWYERAMKNIVNI